MKTPIAALKTEFRPMLDLAVPVVLAELGWMAMGVVDTMMVGRVSAEAIGGVAVGRAVVMVTVVLGVGVLLGLDTMVSQAFGALRITDCHRALVQGCWLSLFMAPPLTLLVRFVGDLLSGFGLDPEVYAQTAPYIDAASWALLPLFLYTALRRYLQGMSLVRPVMIALLSANLVNIAGNWILIYGNLGFPALGAGGAGWATVIASWYMSLVLLLAAVLHRRDEKTALVQAPLLPEWSRLRELLRLGIPTSAYLLLEMGVFALGSVLAGRLHPSELAAHHVAINLASVTFMVPLGISSAAAVRVGQALGRNDPEGAGRAGWTALLFAATFMSLSAVVFFTVPRTLIRLFTTDAAVIVPGVVLLYLAAAFQLFDGVQVVATGALRGAGDTRTPLISNAFGYWLLALPVGYYLCFNRGWGAAGIWVGFLLGLVTCGIVLLAVWARLTRAWAGTVTETSVATPNVGMRR